MIAGIVLAAGRSTRMGTPKALLHLDHDTFLSRVVRTLSHGGVDQVLVVVDSQIDISAGLPGDVPRITLVTNPAPERGQLSSLWAALDALSVEDIDCALVTLVDLPLVTEHTVRVLIDAYGRTRAPIVRPTHSGRHGHPVIFDKGLFRELRLADPDVGAREVVHRHGGTAVNIEVDDPGVVRDIDTPEDYRRLHENDYIRKE